MSGMDNDSYLVLINDEEQYSLWKASLPIPAGWFQRFEGSKEACLAYVEESWIDMRPKSLRDSMNTQPA